jgi:hypothetical protein
MSVALDPAHLSEHRDWQTTHRYIRLKTTPMVESSFPRKRESGATASSLALDLRFRGGDGRWFDLTSPPSKPSRRPSVD